MVVIVSGGAKSAGEPTADGGSANGMRANALAFWVVVKEVIVMRGKWSGQSET